MCATGECSDCSVLADLELDMSRGQTAWGRGVAEAKATAAAIRRDATVTVNALIEDVSAGLRVLRTRDGVPLTEDAIRERAANIVAGLTGNYHIEPLPELAAAHRRLSGVRYARPPATDDNNHSTNGRVR